MKITFQGHSDDTFSWTLDDHDDCANYRLRIIEIKDGDVGMLVTGQYAPDGIPGGTWVIGVSLLDDGVPLPDWPMVWGVADNEYSPTLTITVPDTATVKMIAGGRDD